MKNFLFLALLSFFLAWPAQADAHPRTVIVHQRTAFVPLAVGYSNPFFAQTVYTPPPCPTAHFAYGSYYAAPAPCPAPAVTFSSAYAGPSSFAFTTNQNQFFSYTPTYGYFAPTVAHDRFGRTFILP